jgi:catechol 2,3-dioxygenase-like lactoylglutathione lyase family enzyme
MKMKRVQIQGLHHVTIVGSTKKSAVDFWQGVMGMPFIFEQPNLGNPEENHLYFDPGDGRLLTVFTNETRFSRYVRGSTGTPHRTRSLVLRA